MPCSTCAGGTYTYHQCDVCKLVDKDYNQKPCIWCDTCHAWLCETDNSLAPHILERRAKAAIKRAELNARRAMRAAAKTVSEFISGLKL